MSTTSKFEKAIVSVKEKENGYECVIKMHLPKDEAGFSMFEKSQSGKSFKMGHTLRGESVGYVPVEGLPYQFMVKLDTYVPVKDVDALAEANKWQSVVAKAQEADELKSEVEQLKAMVAQLLAQQK